MIIFWTYYLLVIFYTAVSSIPGGRPFRDVCSGRTVFAYEGLGRTAAAKSTGDRWTGGRGGWVGKKIALLSRPPSPSRATTSRHPSRGDYWSAGGARGERRVMRIMRPRRNRILRRCVHARESTAESLYITHNTILCCTKHENWQICLLEHCKCKFSKKKFLRPLK